MSRDWDKLKRLDRSKPLGPVDSFTPKFKSKKSNGVNLYGSYHEPKSTPTYYRSVTITGDNLVARARFKVSKGKWTCIKADPAIEWFLRVNHPEVIEQWIRKTHFQRVWGPIEHERQPQTPCAADSDNKRPSTAEDYTPNKASHPPGVNTGETLNPKPRGATECLTQTPMSLVTGAEWTDQASPLNTVGCPT